MSKPRVTYTIGTQSYQGRVWDQDGDRLLVDRDGTSDVFTISQTGNHAQPVAPVVPPVTPPPVQPPAGVVWESSYENGLDGFNTAGVGDVKPTVVDTPTRDDKGGAGRFVLAGSQSRSELIVGGDGSGDYSGSILLNPGQHFVYRFSVYIEQMVYGHAGAHNLFFQLKSEGTGSPQLALYLWDQDGHRGLWVSSHGDRYVAPIAEREWHDVEVEGVVAVSDGSYKISLDGQVVEERTNVQTLTSGRGYAYLKSGLYRNGPQIPGTSVLLLDAHSLTH